jgi:hypothetical protein
MKTLVDLRLRRETAHFRFLFNCEACAHFAPETRACANGYPNLAHLSKRLEASSELEFCKEFELA